MVVGIGASAGGLNALQRLVGAVPADSGMAFVVILHLDPERESRMGELLQNRAAIPVIQVSGPTVVEPNHIYIIPPGDDLVMRGQMLELKARGERSEHAPVDLLFRTLAEAHGASAVGVILSGTGVDGTAGIRYIREAGGVTVAQSPGESEYGGMPGSAISTGMVDLVLEAAHVPAELLRIRRLTVEAGNGSAGTVETEAALVRVFGILRSHTGHDFSLYKRSTVLRRINRRLRFNGVDTLDDYVPVLESSGPECEALLRDLLISVSSFIRDPEAFEALGALAGSLFEGKGSEDAVRVWVVGCATGEEVYSLAMVLAEHAATLHDPPRIQMFATDIDEQGYAWARAGLYSAAAVANVSPDRLRRYFVKEPGGYRIVKALREMVLFAGHNVLHDPPFSRMDLISCRNLFIYLQQEAQERVLETFHFALAPDGVLFLGAAEGIGDSGLFATYAAGTQRLYRRGTSPHRASSRVSSADPAPGIRSGGVPAGVAAPVASSGARLSYGALHVRMLEQYAPASVIVDERLDIVHLSAGAGRFLELRGGEPTHNLIGLAPEKVRRALRTALHHAFASGTSSIRQVALDTDEGRRQVSVHVRPSTSDGEVPGRFALVLFEPVAAETGRRAARSARALSDPPQAVIELEEELRCTRDLLESTGAAHDLTMTELQTVNEELQTESGPEEETGSAAETPDESVAEGAEPETIDSGPERLSSPFCD